MVRIIKKGLLPPDDPIFTGEVQVFAIRKSRTKPAEQPTHKKSRPKKQG